MQSSPRIFQGDIVHYNEEIVGYLPAIITRVYPGETLWPEIAMTAFCTGFHGASFEVKRASHGKKTKQYITHEEYLEIELEKLDAENQKKQQVELAKLKKAIEAEGQAKAE